MTEKSAIGLTSGKALATLGSSERWVSKDCLRLPLGVCASEAVEGCDAKEAVTDRLEETRGIPPRTLPSAPPPPRTPNSVLEVCLRGFSSR